MKERITKYAIALLSVIMVCLLVVPAIADYTIDGGSNVDERPKGFYDFLTEAGEDKWAFRYQFCGDGDPSIEFTPAQYVNISADDDLKVCDVTTTDGYYAAHRFNFSINESALEMGVINATWIGRGWHDSGPGYHGANLSIWNFTSAAYEELDSTTDGTEVTLTGGVVVATPSDYVNSGNVTILVKQTSAQIPPPPTPRKSHICTDYVKLVVTP